MVKFYYFLTGSIFGLTRLQLDLQNLAENFAEISQHSDEARKFASDVGDAINFKEEVKNGIKFFDKKISVILFSF